MNILAKKQQGKKFDGIYVEEDDATEWIEKYLSGKIDKVQLDDQRLKESLGLDMLQNTNFVYHPESLLETQIFCLLFVFFYTNGMMLTYDKSLDNRNNLKTELKDSENSNFIMLTLLAEHILSWLIVKFRHYDIE